MLEIPFSQYNIVIPLIATVPYDTVFARSVIEGKQKGRIFVDVDIVPSVVLIVQESSGFALLCGSDDNECFNSSIIDILLSKIRISNQLRLVVHPKVWEAELEALLGNRLVYCSDIENDKNLTSDEKRERMKLLVKENVIGWIRVKFKFNRSKYENNVLNTQMPDGFALRKIDEGLLGKITGSIVPGFYWDSDSSFLKEGIGFCLMRNDVIVSTSFSAFICNNMIDIGIETNPAYRGQGLGVFSAAAMIKYCLENGYEPIWGTRRDNCTSARLAKKLGFEELLTHPSYWSLKPQ